jgi:hypothetical protein
MGLRPEALSRHPEPERHGFMDDGRFPRSRDWGQDDIPCKRTTCVCNRGEMCVVPSKCVIGEDGRCEGYTPKQPPGTMTVQNEKKA